MLFTRQVFPRAWIVLGCLALCSPACIHAQGRGGGPTGGGMGGPPSHGGGAVGADGFGGMQFPPNHGGINRPSNLPESGGQRAGDARPGLQLGPAGQRWWDDRSFVKSLKLRPEQQAQMDAIFEQNRTTLLSRFENVLQAEAQLNELANMPSPDEAALFTQIDRVAQARAELEKANTHLLLELRKQMEPDQIKKLEQQY